MAGTTAMALLSPPKLRSSRQVAASGDGPANGGVPVPALYPHGSTFGEPPLEEATRCEDANPCVDSPGRFRLFKRRNPLSANRPVWEPAPPLAGPGRDARLALLFGLGSMVPVAGLAAGPVAIWHSWRALTGVHRPGPFLEAFAGFILGVICTVVQCAFLADMFAWAFLGR